MPRTYYLPELHDFEYIARAPWPIITNRHQQLDWIAAVDELEAWLNRYIGHHYAEWAYHNGTTVDYWTACIAFKRERNKTLFLLTWT
jgi:hypothetical protein